jgi:hypothetical protein
VRRPPIRGTGAGRFFAGIPGNPAFYRASRMNPIPPAPVQRSDAMIAGSSKVWGVLIASTLAVLLALLVMRWGLRKWIDSAYKKK